MKTKLQTALKTAMKARDQVTMDTIRAVMSAIDYEEMQKAQSPLPEQTITEILKREVKRRDEEKEFAKQGGRADQLAQLDKEIAVLSSFLPKQLSADQLKVIITDLKAATPGANMGVIMKALKEKYAGQYDSKMASELAK